MQLTRASDRGIVSGGGAVEEGVRWKSRSRASGRPGPSPRFSDVIARSRYILSRVWSYVHSDASHRMYDEFEGTCVVFFCIRQAVNASQLTN